jgi:hypothetical protein
MKCLDPPLEYKPNTWRCTICKENRVKAKVEPVAKENKKEAMALFDGEHDDDCYMCFNGGGKFSYVNFNPCIGNQVNSHVPFRLDLL